MKKAKTSKRKPDLAEMLIELASSGRTVSLTGGIRVMVPSAKHNWTCELHNPLSADPLQYHGNRPTLVTRRAWRAIQKEQTNDKK